MLQSLKNIFYSKNAEKGVWKNYAGGTAFVVVAGLGAKFLAPNFLAATIAKLTFASKVATIAAFSGAAIASLLLGTLVAAGLRSVQWNKHATDASAALQTKTFWTGFGAAFVFSALVVAGLTFFTPSLVPVLVAKPLANTAILTGLGTVLSGLWYKASKGFAKWFVGDEVAQAQLELDQAIVDRLYRETAFGQYLNEEVKKTGLGVLADLMREVREVPADADHQARPAKPAVNFIFPGRIDAEKSVLGKDGELVKAAQDADYSKATATVKLRLANKF